MRYLHFLKISSFIAHPLIYLINKSFETDCFPDQLECVNVAPMHKIVRRTDFSNYRHVAILPSLSKIFEKAVYVRLMSHFACNNLFHNLQFGFRKK